MEAGFPHLVVGHALPGAALVEGHQDGEADGLGGASEFLAGEDEVPAEPVVAEKPPAGLVVRLLDEITQGMKHGHPVGLQLVIGEQGGESQVPGADILVHGTAAEFLEPPPDEGGGVVVGGIPHDGHDFAPSHAIPPPGDAAQGVEGMEFDKGKIPPCLGEGPPVDVVPHKSGAGEGWGQLEERPIAAGGIQDHVPFPQNPLQPLPHQVHVFSRGVVTAKENPLFAAKMCRYASAHGFHAAG